MKSIKKLLFLISLFSILQACDNDDANAPNQNVCNYQGASIENNNNNTQILIPESDLQTDLFPNNDGVGMPAVEIWDTTNPRETFIVTRALTVGAVDTNPEIRINGNNYNGTVTCQRTGTQVGDELRLDIIITNLGEAELCVIIDQVTP